MKRWIFKLCLFLLLGAIINIAVAWGFALGLFDKLGRSPDPLDFSPAGFYERSRSGPRTFIHIERGRMTLWQDGPGFNVDYLLFPEQIDEAQYRRLVPHWSAFARGEPAFDGQVKDLLCYSELASGWPFLSLSCAYESEYEPRMTFSSRNLGGFEFPDSAKSIGLKGIVPLRPIWPGFAINTTFYAAILWLPFAALGAFRRRRRIKRGLCPACAYDLRGSTSKTCPECGKAIAMLDSRKPTAESPQ